MAGRGPGTGSASIGRMIDDASGFDRRIVSVLFADDQTTHHYHQ